MDVLLSAVASDLVGRLVSFLVGRYQQEPGARDNAGRLQSALLRARVVVEEAEGRQIANWEMLRQLNQLRRELCRATYAVDAFRWRERRSQVTMRQFLSHTARPPLSSDCSDVLPVMVESLEATLSDMREFVVLLGGFPRVTRQPYSTYLFMENCMFGRHVEKEEIISFLLQPARDLDVLPVIGPHWVGKRTLVEHVLLDERVRERFAKIHHLSSNELDLHSHEHHHHGSLFDLTARSLTVIDIVDDGGADVEAPWRKFHSAVCRRAHRGSKVIVMSRTEAHSSLFGTVPPLKLRALRQEDLWYFFRALAFGAADPNERPDLARIAMALCKGITHFGLLAAANIIAATLRADLSAHSWRRVLKVFSEAAVLQVNTATGDRLDEDRAEHYYLCRPVKDAPGAQCLFYNRHKLTGIAPSQLPKVTMVNLLNGSSRPPAGETRFDVLAWQSRIPPYACYIATCDTDRARHQQVIALKTRFRNKRRRDHQENNPSN